jgi:hypothetical protein
MPSQIGETDGVAQQPVRPGKSVTASVVGWVIVGIIAFWLLGAVFSTVFWLLRSAIWIALLGGLIWLYLRLKAGRD